VRLPFMLSYVRDWRESERDETSILVVAQVACQRIGCVV